MEPRPLEFQKDGVSQNKRVQGGPVGGQLGEWFCHLRLLYTVAPTRAPSPDLGEPSVGLMGSWVVMWGGVDRMAAEFPGSQEACLIRGHGDERDKGADGSCHPISVFPLQTPKRPLSASLRLAILGPRVLAGCFVGAG